MKYLFLVLTLMCHVYVNGQVKTFNLLGAEWHNPNAWTPVGVPTANDSVLILGICAIKADSTARAKYVFIEKSFGILEIQRDIPTMKRGILVINDAPGNALVNEGTFINGGRLTIRRTRDTAVVNRGSFANLDLSRVVIDSTVNNAGIYNEDRFTNSGMTEISRIKTFGISNNDTIVNNDLGEFIIERNGYGGIFNQKNAQFNNHGYLSISNSNFDGISNSGEFINFDTIVIDSSSIGFLNNEIFLNNIGASLNISNSTINGIHNNELTASQITNKGKIAVMVSGSVGIRNEGDIYNFDSLIIQSSSGGISNQISFINDSTGVIILKQIIGEPGISNDRTFENRHKIVIRNVSNYGIDNDDLFINHDSMLITKTDGHGFYNKDILQNKHGAFISIHDLTGLAADGINNINGENTLINEGKIDIKNIPAVGINNFGSLLNKDTIFINNTSAQGIFTNKYLINETGGFISVSDLTGVNAIGIENFDQGDTVKNYGMIRLENLEEYGFINGGFIGNYDSIMISDIGYIGIHNLDSFFNASTGFIEIQDGPNYIPGFGLFNNLDARILNQGTYWLTDVETGVINLGRIDNTDLIQVNGADAGLLNGTEDGIGELHNSGNLLFENLLFGVVNQAKLVNSLTGHVSISNYTNNPFESVLGSTFDCLGTLDIGTIDVH